MKILMVAPLFRPHIGGVEKHIERVSQELIERGHEVNIVTMKHDKELPDFEEFGKMKVYRFPRCFHPHIYIPFMGFQEITVDVWWWLFKHRRLIQNSDLVHCHDFSTFVYWYLPFRFIYPQKRVFITFHGWEGIFPIPRKIILQRKIAEFFTKGNICVGHYIPAWYGTSCDFVTYGGIDEPKEPPPKALRISAVFIGRLERDTDVLEYIDTIKILREEYNMEIKLEICGDGTLRERIQEIIKRMNLSIILQGFVKNPIEYLRRNRFSFATGYLTILESMINKRLVFCVYTNPLKKDYLTLMPNSRTIMITSSSGKELARKIRKIIDNPKIEKRMIKRAYDFAKKQTWGKVADAYLKLWHKCIK